MGEAVRQGTGPRCQPIHCRATIRMRLHIASWRKAPDRSTLASSLHQQWSSYITMLLHVGSIESLFFCSTRHLLARLADPRARRISDFLPWN
jgi:hypothetical protein